SKWEKLAAEKEERAKLKKGKTSGAHPEDVVGTPMKVPPTPGDPPNLSDLHLGTNTAQAGKDFQSDVGVRKFKIHARGASYEEYEQAITSPWSQSPAPSPAIRSDPNENPFFTSSKVDEESFN